MSKGQTAETSDAEDPLVGPREDVADTSHLLVHAKHGVVTPDETAEVGQVLNLYVHGAG